MLNFLQLLLMISLMSLLSSCDLYDRMALKGEEIQSFEVKALYLVKENRALKNQISQQNFRIQSLKAENNYLKVKLEKAKIDDKKKRDMASIKPTYIAAKNDLVNYDLYKWTDKQMLKFANDEYKVRNYDKAAQFYHALISIKKDSKLVNDKVIYQAGVAAFRSQIHFKWADKYLDQLIVEYNTSEYFRGAKLWKGLTALKMGDHKTFFATVEEFRKKYRNTPEWTVLSSHYEEFTKKYK